MMGVLSRRSIVEDDDFVDGEDGEGMGKVIRLGYVLFCGNEVRLCEICMMIW